jgi:hypothetical protein
MFRRFALALLVVLVMGVSLIAAEIKGRIVKVDASNRKITMTVNDKEQEFTLTKDARILGPKGDLKDGLRHKVFQSERALKKGIPATLMTEKKDDREQVTEVKLGGGKKKPEQP